ncbi:MAG: GyrI-like domain-containing protein [Oscillospiraceae bacterium]
MARISDIALVHRPELHLLSVRRTIDFMREYSQFTEEVFGDILRYLARQGRLPGSAPLVCFHNTNLEKLDVEAGFVVPDTVGSKGDMKSRNLQAIKTAVAYDMSPYEQQDPTLQAVMDWITEQGYQAKGEIWYEYLNDTNRPEEQFLTKMMVPIK